MTKAEVAVIGAGPTGLMLACELALAGVRCAIFERRLDAPNITRAFAVHARTLELLDARGLADEVMALGHPMTTLAPAPGVTIDLSSLDSPFRMVLMVPQSGTETVLEKRAAALGVEIVRGAEVVGLHQDRNGVELELSEGGRENARYVVGCDGAHNAVRRLAGIAFAGTQYRTDIMLADVRVDAPDGAPMFAQSNRDGLVLVLPYGDGYSRLIAWDLRQADAAANAPLELEDVRDAFVRIAGSDYGMHDVRWMSRFRSERRQAERYRIGNVFVAGDAAHVHSPIGGQGMNTGIQDAMNLGWKLAASLRGWGPDALLETYQAERHPVGTQVLALTDGLTRLVLSRSRLRHALQPALLRALLRFPPARAQLLSRGTGLGIAYPRSHDDHPMVGRRVSDRPTSGGRLYELLRTGRFVLLESTGARALGDAHPWVDKVAAASVDRHNGEPAAILVRPDGYAAWASDRTGPELTAAAAAALQRWCSTSSAALSET